MSTRAVSALLAPAMVLAILLGSVRPVPDVAAEGRYAAAVLADGPVSYYRLDEPSGTTAADRMGRNPAAYCPTGVVRGRPDTFTGADADAAVGFDASAAGCVIANPFQGFPTDAASVEMWVRTSDTAHRGTMFSYATQRNGVLVDNAFRVVDQRDLFVSVNEANSPGGGVPSAARAGVSVRKSSAASGVAIDDGGWHHLVFTWRSSDGDARLYKDGTLVYETALSAGSTIATQGVLVLGQDQDTLGGGFDDPQALVGDIDEVAIYPTVLAPERVAAHFRLALGLQPYESLLPWVPRRAGP